MITLKTLAEATPQQVFDQVATHLLTQNQRAYDPESGRCYYRYEGLQCAAGCLIAKGEYLPGMKGSWMSIIRNGFVPATVHDRLIQELQNLHDTSEPETWEEALRIMAHKHGLEMPTTEHP